MFIRLPLSIAVLSALLAVSAEAARDSTRVPADSLGTATANRPAVPDTLPWVFEPGAIVLSRSEAGARGIEPSGIAVDAFGRIVVSDAALHRVLRYAPEGSYLGEAGALGSDAGQMRRPGSVVTLGTLNVGVLDAENRRVLSYDLFGRFQGVLLNLLAPEVAQAVGGVTPLALASDRGGAFAIADSERDRLLVFDFGGRYLRTVGGLGARPGSFRALRGVAFTKHGEIVTAERGGARIQRLDTGGRVTGSWPIAVTPGAAQLALAVDDRDRIALADEATGVLRLFDSAGRLLARRAGLEGPRALAFDRDGSLLVAEAAAGRVQRWTIRLREGPPGRSTE